MAWLVTLPAAGLTAAGVNRALSGLGPGSAGAIVIALPVVAAAALLFRSAQRRPITAEDV
jgi:hypothetical protein